MKKNSIIWVMALLLGTGVSTWTPYFTDNVGMQISVPAEASGVIVIEGEPA